MIKIYLFNIISFLKWDRLKCIILFFGIVYNLNLFAQDTTYMVVQDSTYLFTSNPLQQSIQINLDSTAHLKHIHPLPLECSKIKVGFSSDTLVRKLYGKGFFDSEDSHGGARYFVDSKRTIILKTAIGVDNIIEEIGFSSYDYPFDFVKNEISSLKASNKLNINPFILGNINLGDSLEKLILNFGTPNKDEIKNGIRSIIYEDSYEEWSDVLYYSAIFEFRQNKLIRFFIYNGE